MENKIIIILAGVCFVFVVLSVLFIALYATKDDDEDGTIKIRKTRRKYNIIKWRKNLWNIISSKEKK